jgi:hypothetical protein
MRQLILLTATLLGLSVAHAGVLAQGNDCGVVSVTDGQITTVEGKKILLLTISVENRAYDKEIYLVNTRNHQGAKAIWSDYWSQYDVTAKTIGKTGAGDLIQLRSQQVGPEDSYTLAVYVKMQGQDFACSGIQVSK